MRYVRTKRFKKAVARLPGEIQTKAARAFMLFKENQRHPYEGDVCVFRNIGPHVIVEREP